MKRLLALMFGLAFAAAGGAASAANAYSQGIVHLRAGPSTEYPVVMSIPPNSLLQVSGCLDDYTWCDVDWEGNRGWVYGNYLYYDYQNRRVPVLQFGASLGVGIVSFSIGDYWPRYYSGRPWYGRENYWLHRPPPPRRPPPLRPRPPARPGGPPPRPVTPPRPPRPSPPAKPAPVRPPLPRPMPQTRPATVPDAPSSPSR